MNIPFYKHQLGSPEICSFSTALQGDILTTGDEVSAFEHEFSQFLNVSHSVALQSCTAALHLALEAFEFPSGSEVITTPMTFVATALSILQAGLTPVFCDIDPDTGNINLDEIESHITNQTVAVMPVHLYGQMVDMTRLSAICRRHNLKCIEDAAHCVEGSRDGYGPGALSDAACFSFYATKNITCGEGGCLSTNNSLLADRVRLLRSHGVDKTAIDRYRSGYSHWQLSVTGWKYNLDNLHASILRPQIPLIKTKLMRREYLCRFYELSLNKLEEVSLLKRHRRVIHARHLFPIRVHPSQRDALIMHLQNHGIGTVVNYRSLDNYQLLIKRSKFSETSFCNSSVFGDSVLSLPLYPQLRADQARQVVQTIYNFFGKTYEP